MSTFLVGLLRHYTAKKRVFSQTFGHVFRTPNNAHQHSGAHAHQLHMLLGGVV